MDRLTFSASNILASDVAEANSSAIASANVEVDAAISGTRPMSHIAIRELYESIAIGVMHSEPGSNECNELADVAKKMVDLRVPFANLYVDLINLTGYCGLSYVMPELRRVSADAIKVRDKKGAFEYGFDRERYLQLVKQCLAYVVSTGCSDISNVAKTVLRDLEQPISETPKQVVEIIIPEPKMFSPPNTRYLGSLRSILTGMEDLSVPNTESKSVTLTNICNAIDAVNNSTTAIIRKLVTNSADGSVRWSFDHFDKYRSLELLGNIYGRQAQLKVIFSNSATTEIIAIHIERTFISALVDGDERSKRIAMLFLQTVSSGKVLNFLRSEIGKRDRTDSVRPLLELVARKVEGNIQSQIPTLPTPKQMRTSPSQTSTGAPSRRMQSTA